MVSYHPAMLVAISTVVVGISGSKLLKRNIPDVLPSIHHYCLSLKDMA